MKILNENNVKLKFNIQGFKQEIEDFLINANVSPDMIYHVKNQLSIQVGMPYYRDKNKGKRNRLNKLSIIFEISKILANYNNSSFTRRLMQELAKNQGQALRGLSKKLKLDYSRKPNRISDNIYERVGTWEHLIPIKYIRDTIINYIDNNQMNELESFLHWVENNTFQVFLTKEEDDKVNSFYREDMPPNWNWKTGDIFIRYKIAGVREDLYK